MSTISTEDGNIYYESRGDGEPLILIPGLGTGSWLWFKQVPAFARSFRTITFDPPGVGRSTASGAASSTTRSLADGVANLLDALGVARAHVLGASLGGFVAQEFALAYPHKTGSLVLCCTSAGGARHVPTDAAVLLAYASNFALSADERIRQNLSLSFAPRYVAEQADEVERVLELRLANSVPDDVYLRQVRAGQSHDADARVGRIGARTLVITGDADRVVPAENSANLAGAIPRAKLLVMPGGSHLFFIEQADAFNSAVVEFIRDANPDRA